MARTLRQNLTTLLFSFILLSCLLLGCRELNQQGAGKGKGDASESSNSQKASSRSLTGYNTILHPGISGNVLRFDEGLTDELLSDGSLSPSLELRFKNNAQFSTSRLKVALNGILGNLGEEFDLSSAARWVEDDKGWKLVIELNDLAFDLDKKFVEKMRRVRKFRGHVRVWIDCGPPRIAEAVLIFRAPDGGSGGTPEIIFDKVPEPIASSRVIEYRFHASNGTPAFECAIDRRPLHRCVSPLRFHIGNGRHVFQVRAVMADRSRGPIASHEFEVVPWPHSPIAITGAIPSGSPVSNSSIAISFSPATDKKVGNEWRRLVCSLDGGRFASCQSPFRAEGLADGEHKFLVRYSVGQEGNSGNSGGSNGKGKANSGNNSPASETPAVYVWVVDRTAPRLVWIETPPESTPSSSARFVFEASEAATFECEIDGAPVASCESPLELSGLAAGPHSLKIAAKDLAGNAALPVSFVWTVDDGAPEVSLTGVNPPQNPSGSREVEFSFVASEPVTFRCQLDGAVVEPCQSPLALAGLSDGEHEFIVSGTDNSGNASLPVAYYWVIDTRVPTLTLSLLFPDRLPTMFDSARFDFVPSESATFYCDLDHRGVSQCDTPYEVSGLAEGRHTLIVSAVDGAGNAGVPATFSWDIDRTAPQLEILSVVPAEAVVAEQSIQLAFGASEAVNATCDLDESGAIPCQSPFQKNDLADGRHNLVVRATDAAGNQAQPVSHAWEIVTATDVSIDSVVPADLVTKSRDVTFTFSSSNASSFECSLDNGGFVACTSAASFSSLSDGRHTFDVRGVRSGMPGAAASHYWTVDNAAPVVSIDGAVPSAIVTNSREIAISFSSADAAVFYCKLDGGSEVSCSSPFVLGSLVDGAHEVGISAEDSVGNRSNPVYYRWNVDTVAPVVSIVGRSPSSEIVASSTVQFAFLANEVVNFSCGMDGGGAQACSSPHTVNGLADGAHTFSITAVDAAGNQSAAASMSFVVDATLPQARITFRDPAASPTNQKSVAVGFDANEAASFVCSLDGAAYAPCTSPYTASGLADGTHVFHVKALDFGGNQGDSVNTSWVVDTVGPSVSIVGLSPAHSPTSQSALTVTFTASETSTYSCQLDGGGAQACSSPYTVSGLGDGSHQISIVATDGAGNAGSPQSYSWTVDSSALVVSNLSINNIMKFSATVNWLTNLSANSRVIYGEGAALDNTTSLDASYVTSHSVNLTGLKRFTLYSVQAVSIDRDGRESRSSVVTFRTSN